MIEPDELAFKARALAQAHPLTPLVRRYLDRAIAEQRTTQPMLEIGIWAGAGITNGYCLRRVEEDQVGLELAAIEEPPIDIDELDAAAGVIAAAMRTGTNDHWILPGDLLLAALDRIIASEVDRRLEHWRDTIDDRAWAELEEYITWWVVKGYALRVAERDAGAVAAVEGAAR
jgi:hypothetical protein